MNTLAGAAIVVLIFLVALHLTGATKTSGCAPGPCTDPWFGSDGKPVAAQLVCDPATGLPAAPNYGPGQCASPCQPGETACWDALNGAGHCVVGPCSQN